MPPKPTKKTSNNQTTHLSVEDERRFQHDLKEILKRTDGSVPKNYDARGAWKGGGVRRVEDLAKNTTTGKYEWPTEWEFVRARRVPHA